MVSAIPCDVTIVMSQKKRTLFILSLLLLNASSTAAGYGSSVALPVKLLQMDGMSYYPFCSALGTMGMMLTLPLVGKLSDLFGQKWIAAFGVMIHVLTRIMMVFTSNTPLFMLLYALSSIGNGLFVSTSLAFISEVVTIGEQSKYFGFVATSSAIGALCGPIIAGQLVGNGYTGLAFAAYTPFSVIAILLILALYPDIRLPRNRNYQFDFAGVWMLVIGISCIVLWLSLGGTWFGWTSPVGIGLLCIGVVFIIALIFHEGKHPNPTIPIRMFLKKRFRISFICSALLTAYISCAVGFGIIYAQQIMNVSAQLSATITMPQTIVQIIMGVLIGRILSKDFDKRFRPVAILSTILATLATLVLSCLKPTSPLLVLYISGVIGGFSTSINQMAFIPFYQSELDPSDNVSAQSMYSFAGTGGACLFTAISGAILNNGLTYNHVFLLATTFCATAFIIGLFGFRLQVKQKHTNA